MIFHVKVKNLFDAQDFLIANDFTVSQVEKPKDLLSVEYIGKKEVAEIRAVICETPGYLNNVWLS